MNTDRDFMQLTVERWIVFVDLIGNAKDGSPWLRYACLTRPAPRTVFAMLQRKQRGLEFDVIIKVRFTR
jgi:hypothetical protein